MLNAVIIFMVCISCIPYYFKYEKKKPQTRESVVLAVMIALTVASRMLFAFSPGFKPVSAMVIICGMAFWKRIRFFVWIFKCRGIKLLFWTRTMDSISRCLHGEVIGWISGILNQRKWLENSKILLTIFGILSGISYSFVMDIWTLLAAGDGFQWMRYVAVLGTSVPVTIEYCVSNVIFLWILTSVFVKKLNRVKYKYGFFKDEEVRKLINQ